MSLAPKWYSTIYGVNFWGSACVGGFAYTVRADRAQLRSRRQTGRLVHSINANHYHDIGRVDVRDSPSSGAYTAFSQFMLQWYGNMPEETVWYKYRLFGDWQWVAVAMLVGFCTRSRSCSCCRGGPSRIVPSLVTNSRCGSS